MRTLISDGIQDNLGGLVSIFAIPESSFVRVRTDYTNSHGSGLSKHFVLETINEDDIIRLDSLNGENYSFSEKAVETDAGIRYDIRIKGLISRFSPDMQCITQELQNSNWYVVAHDENGFLHLCGVRDALLSFTGTSDTGNKAHDLNAFSFEFACSQDIPSVFISAESFFHI